MILPNNRNDWPVDAIEEWQERAAIVEYNGKITGNHTTRRSAESYAEQCVRKRWKTLADRADH